MITSTTLSAATTSTTTLPQQGLVHWMNAVMAEHMTVTSGSHHHHHLHPHLPHHHTLHHSLHTHPDPAVGMNYTMWNTIDVSFFNFHFLLFLIQFNRKKEQKKNKTKR